MTSSQVTLSKCASFLPLKYPQKKFWRLAEPKSAREKRIMAQSWEALRASGNPVYDIDRENADIFSEKPPAEILADSGVRHEINLVPGSEFCVTR